MNENRRDDTALTPGDDTARFISLLTDAESAMKKLPKQVHVAWEQTDSEPYLIAQETLDGLVDVGEERTVGVYQLIETVKLHGRVDVVRGKRGRR